MNKFYLPNTTLKTLTIYFCFSFAVLQSINAQSPVLTAANSSLQLGDKFVFHYCTTTIFDTSHSGINQVWDYSYLQDSTLSGTPVIDTQICISPSLTVYGDSFPNATIATTHTNPSGVSPHNDYYSNGTGFFSWGYYLGSNYVIYKKTFAQIPLYPVTYASNYIDSSTYVDSSFFNPLPNNIPYTYTGADTLYADGYGTLILPDTTIQNVVRIKATISYTTPTTNGYLFNRKVVAYYFYTPNYHANIFALQYLTNTYSFNGVIIPAFTTEGKIIYRASNTNEVLPLQIISFNGSLNNNDVVLQWKTAQEENTNYFTIQRSADGSNFKNIGKVLAAGNSSLIKSYTYTDMDVAALKASKLFYRLQEVDIDGKGTYSNIKVVSFAKQNLIFSVSPNPSKDFINIISSNDIANAQVKITDMNGKILAITRQNFIAGKEFKLLISSFPKGVLIVGIEGSNNYGKFKIIRE